jgi:ATP-binding cassette subfamily F protein 3
MILSCNNISKAFGTEQIITNCSFHIEDREKAAIVGINGAGKSTLLKIIVGQMPADTGLVTLAKDKTLGYLAQHQNLTSDSTIYDELLTVKQDIIDMEEKIRALEIKMKSVDENELETLLNQYTRLTHEFELNNGYAYKSEVTGVLKGLGFSEEDFSLSVSTLSGGQKTRVALGKLLLAKPDIILLDEPTNHLDMESISWLENYLLTYNGSVIIVAHDRYFLDKIVSKIIEIDHSNITVFSGNYTDYAAKKAILRNMQLKEYLNQQRDIKHQEAVITKLKQFNREKSIKRAESREKMLDKIERVEKPLELNDKMNISLDPQVLSGNDVLTVRSLSKAFDENILFQNISFDIKRGERIALIGNNGTGKTTILKIINDILPADSGEIRLGSKVCIGYYDQEHHVLNPDNTLFDELQDAYPDLTNTQIRNTLAAFLFTNDDVFKYIRDLSGGEKGRVSLAKLMLSNANFLILDEPTNHLDITSKEILENALNSYTGTVLYVSHDRYFINTTATRIIELTNQTVVNYIGNYDYYMEKKDILSPLSSVISTANSDNHTIENQGNSSHTDNATACAIPAKEISRADWKQSREVQVQLRKKKNELKKAEDRISEIEQRISEIDLSSASPEICSNTSKLLELHKEREQLSEELDKLYERWEELSEELSEESTM